MTKYFNTSISNFTQYLPQKVVTNSDLSNLMDTSDAWIKERTGIAQRRYAEKNVTTSDLAIGAVKKLLEESNFTPQDFDCIIACTLSPDYYFPGIGPIIQNKLKFSNIPCFDLRVQCSAFVYATQMANAFIQTGQYKRILGVFSDLQSRFLDLTTRGRNMAVLFADGAAAVVYEAQECSGPLERASAQNKISGVIDTILGADGSGVDFLHLKSPGTATPEFITPEIIESGLCFPFMDGRTVFKHAVTRMLEVAETLLKRNNMTINDINCLIPHQANLRISDYICEKLNIPANKVFNNIQNYGNTTSATIAICIQEALAQGVIKKGDVIMTVAFGAGFTWGGCLIRI